MILNEKTEREVIVKLLEYEDSITKLLENLRELNIELDLPISTMEIWDTIFGEYKDNDNLYDLVFVIHKEAGERADSIINEIRKLRGADNEI